MRSSAARRSVMSWAIPTLGDVLGDTDDLLDDAGLVDDRVAFLDDDALVAVGPDDGVFDAVALHLAGRPPQGLLDTGAIGLGDQREKGVVVERLLALAQPEQPGEARRTVNRVGGQVPVPVAKTRHALGLGEPGLAFAQLVFGFLGPQDVAKAMGQDNEVDRLGDERRRADLEGAVNRGAVIEPGHHHDRRMNTRRHRPDRGAHVEAVHARHDDVEHDHRRADLGEHLERTQAIGRLDHLKAGFFQRLARHEADDGVVDDDEDHGWLAFAHGRVHAACSRWMVDSAALTNG